MGSSRMIMESGTASAGALERAVYGTDEQLVAAVRRGDDRAFERLYERYQRRIAVYAYGMVGDHGRAEDVTQEVFISALRRMRQTDRPIAFKPWVYEIAKNACIDLFRRTRRTEEVSFDAEEGAGAREAARLAAPDATPDAAIDTKQQLNDLCGAFGGLSDTHHQILVLRELEGLSYREIGDRLGLSRPSVESTLFRARRRLTEEYDELVSGARCLRVQELLGSSSRALGARDERRLARHIAHCQPCRRQAHAAGIDTETLAPRRRAIAARVAAFLPLPAFLHLHLRRGGGPLAGGHSATLVQWSGTVSAMAEPAVGWTKAAAAATALLVAGGAGVVGHAPSVPPIRAEPVVAPVHRAVTRSVAKPAVSKHRAARRARVKAKPKPVAPAAARPELRDASPAPAAPTTGVAPPTSAPTAPAPERAAPPNGGLSTAKDSQAPPSWGSRSHPTAKVSSDPVGQIQNLVTVTNGQVGQAVGDVRTVVGGTVAP